MATEHQILNALKSVIDPDLNRDIVSLGFVKNLKVQYDSVSFDLELTTPACPVRHRFKQECEERVLQLPGIRSVHVNLTSAVKFNSVPTDNNLPGVRNTIAVASGKGGVGKSTVAANLALSLQQTGASVGLLDCDIYGPSIPLMFGLVGQQPDVTHDEKIMPLQAHGISVMSIGFLTHDESPVIWRGPMVHKIIQQFLSQVEWGNLDYLVLDLPPGTGDAQLTLVQSISISGAVIVTTPQEMSLIDARKALRMFEKVHVPILGIVENMSYFLCPHCQKESEIFRRGGGSRTSQELGIPFLGEIPIDPEVTGSGDEGVPIVVKMPESAVALAYHRMSGEVARQLSIRNAGI